MRYILVPSQIEENMIGLAPSPAMTESTRVANANAFEKYGTL
jgi:hypothetical protein